ncbi:unnamed protein product [Phaeothamnion confervicola]
MQEGDANGSNSGKAQIWFWTEEGAPFSDQYILMWESRLLRELGKSVETMVLSATRSATQASMDLQEMLKATALSTLMAAIVWPLALISLADMIDTDWTVGCERADLAGVILADALLNREQGCRPVTLVGYSMGARLIFSCLLEMARRDSGGVRHKLKGRGHDEARPAAGIIENVILFGAPVGVGNDRWERANRIVHGRMINAYSSKDWILGLIYRAKSLSLKVSRQVTGRAAVTALQPPPRPGRKSTFRGTLFWRFVLPPHHRRRHFDASTVDSLCCLAHIHLSLLFG